MANPVSTELTDLVYDVLNNTLDAVINARMDQERRYLEMVEDTLLSAEEFIEKHRLRDEVAVTIAGSPVPLQSDDFDQMLRQLYEERLMTLRRFVEDGPPRLRVEKGNVNLKLSFQMQQDVEANTPAGTPQTESDAKRAARIDPTVRVPDLSTRAGLASVSASKLPRAGLTNLQLKLDKQALAKQVYRSPYRKLQASLPDPQEINQAGINALSEISLQFTLD